MRYASHFALTGSSTSLCAHGLQPLCKIESCRLVWKKARDQGLSEAKRNCFELTKTQATLGGLFIPVFPYIPVMTSGFIVNGVKNALAAASEILEAEQKEVAWLVPPSVHSLSMTHGLFEQMSAFVQQG